MPNRIGRVQHAQLGCIVTPRAQSGRAPHSRPNGLKEVHKLYRISSSSTMLNRVSGQDTPNWAAILHAQLG